MKTKILALFVIAVALFAAGCGGDDESSTGGGGAGNETDRAFVSAMVPHHESAVEMATIAQERGESEFVKSLASDIVRTQEAEIETMQAEDAKLEEAGIGVGDLGMDEEMMGMDTDVEMLRTAKPFDPAFLEMMIPHHEAAVTMAEVELDKGSDPELQTVAEQIIESQQRELTEMKAELGDDAGSTDDSTGMDHGG